MWENGNQKGDGYQGKRDQETEGGRRAGGVCLERGMGKGARGITYRPGQDQHFNARIIHLVKRQETYLARIPLNRHYVIAYILL